MASFSEQDGLGETPRGVSRTNRVIVTGGSGKIGRSTVAYLAAQGMEVINVDRVRPAGASLDGKSGIGGAYRLVEIDLEDMGQVLEAFMEIDMAYKGVDQVVHLAAIPSPSQSSSSNQFRTNTMSTYNVIEACRKLRIKNLVIASSETLIGLPWTSGVLPAEIPITENSPLEPNSAYALSKLLGETMSDVYCRWDPELKIVSLRFSNAMVEEAGDYEDFEKWQHDPVLRWWNCWGYIDSRDAGQAVYLSLKAKLVGHHPFLIANNNTVMKLPNTELVKACFPTSKYNPTQGPNDSLLSIEKAKRVLGYEPKHDWKF